MWETRLSKVTQILTCRTSELYMDGLEDYSLVCWCVVWVSFVFVCVFGCCVFPMKILHSIRVSFFQISRCWQTMSRTRSAMQEKKNTYSSLWGVIGKLRGLEPKTRSSYHIKWYPAKTLSETLSSCHQICFFRRFGRFVHQSAKRKWKETLRPYHLYSNNQKRGVEQNGGRGLPGF